MTANEFGRKFDAGEDASTYVDWSKARRPNLESRRVNVDSRRGLSWGWTGRRGALASRQALIRMWTGERLG